MEIKKKPKSKVCDFPEEKQTVFVCVFVCLDVMIFKMTANCSILHFNMD